MINEVSKMQYPAVFPIALLTSLPFFTFCRHILTRGVLFDGNDNKVWTPTLSVVKDNDTALMTFDCMAGATPPPVLTWKKDGEIIQEAVSTDVWSRGVGSTTGRLYVDCPTPGVYECVGQTKQKESSAKYVVEEPRAKKCTQYNGHPRLLQWSRTVLEKQGLDVTLVCRAQGSPAPSISWINNKDKLVTDDHKYQILPSGDLLVRNLVWEDMGSYVCVASNMHGSAKEDAFLYPMTADDKTS